MLTDYLTDEIIMDPFYPCIKYKKSADQKLDGTDYFIIAESMHLREIDADFIMLRCSLTFTCDSDKKAFYKFIQDCLHF